MQLNVQVEKSSEILRKLIIKVPANEIAKRFESGLAEAQRNAKLKGFRPGQAPLSIIKQHYADDIRHRLYHSLIDESFQEAVRAEKLKAVGRPRIESPEAKTGAGEHDHEVREDKDFTFTATVEVLPEIQIKNYTGVSLARESVEIKDEDVEAVVKNMLDSQAELVPASSGLSGADGKPTSRPVRKADFVDVSFDGGIVTKEGIKPRDGMKGSRVVEIGSDALIPGFEEQVIGMRQGETKTFRIPFPKDYFEQELAGKESEFTVTVNEVKEKKLPELTDEFAKQMGHENVADLRKKAREYLVRQRTNEVDQKLRGELVSQLVEKNKFEVPLALIESQTRALAQDWAEELRRQGVDDQTTQAAIMKEIGGLRKRAESQVRASLLLEAVAAQEKIEVSAEDYEAELKTFADSMKVGPEKLREYYAKNPDKKDDFEFRIRQERTLKFLLDKAKIKSKS